MSDLTTFARKLMRINQAAVRTNRASAIFGSLGELPEALSHRASLRIGLWPCISEKPELAMGLWTALAHLLERWRDIEVYRLFAKFEGESFEWTMAASQFEVDDFELEPLDENVGIWGKLVKTGDNWTLTATIDNDNLTGEDNEAQDLSITAASPADFIAKLPDFAALIAENLGAFVMDDTDLPYPAENATDSLKLTDLLQRLLQWEVKLTGSLWGIEWTDEQFVADFDELLKLGEAEGTEFAAWMVAKALAESMRPGYSVLGELLLERLDDVAKAFSKSNSAVPILAGAVFQMGHAPKAHRLLKLETTAKAKNTRAWLKSAELLALGGHLKESIEQFQNAIEQEAVNNHLYRAYANVLLAAEQYGEELDSFILIDFSEYDDDYLLWEAIAAYGKALELDPKDIRALYSRLLQMIYVQENDAALWADFRKLLSLDSKGEYIRDVIESMYELEDVKPGLDELESLLKANPERIDFYINLAALHMSHDDLDAAKPLLEKALKQTSDVNELAEIERLLLAVNDDEFEQRFGEAVGILDAGNELSADEVEFLENVVEKAPHMMQAQLALARAYYVWDEKKDALEVLLDAQEMLPDQAEILNLLARILWESDEKETAFQYLNRGLAAYPFNVALLSRTGQYLFENGQYKESRSYLARAEEIAPRDPYLQAARTFIAMKLAENPKLAESIEAETSEKED